MAVPVHRDGSRSVVLLPNLAASAPRCPTRRSWIRPRAQSCPPGPPALERPSDAAQARNGRSSWGSLLKMSSPVCDTTSLQRSDEQAETVAWSGHSVPPFGHTTSSLCDMDPRRKDREVTAVTLPTEGERNLSRTRQGDGGTSHKGQILPGVTSAQTATRPLGAVSHKIRCGAVSAQGRAGRR